MADMPDPPSWSALTPVPQERRRAGRAERASPHLIPLMRACSACKTEAALFPFTMAFQPIVDLQESRIDSYEALVRGPNGEGAGHVLGQVDAENTYAFDQACRVKAIELAARLPVWAWTGS